MLSINRNHFVEGVSVLPTPNKSGVLNPRLLIVHDTAGGLDYKGSVSWLRNPQAKASAHFVVGRNGEIVQLAAMSVKTWHAGKSIYKGKSNVNDFSIGIEIANPGKMTMGVGETKSRASFGQTFDVKKYGVKFAETAHHGAGWWMPYPEAQMTAVLNLAMAIRDRYEITEVAPHYIISPGRKIDVNPLFPLSWLQAKMKGRQDVDSDVFDCHIAKGAHIRAWPSFNSANILHTMEETTPGDMKRSGTYVPVGDSIPLQTPKDKPILWYFVNVPTGGEGWVPFTDVELL